MTEEKFNLINNSQWSFEKKKRKTLFNNTSFGKLISFFIVLIYFKIMISDKVFNNERTSPRH